MTATEPFTAAAEPSVSTSVDDMQTIQSKVQLGLPTFSRSHRRIADAFLEQPSSFAKLTLGELGEITGASEPTIVRFCGRLGFSGFKDFKARLTTELDGADQAAKSTPRPRRPGETSRLSMEQIRNLLRISAIDALDTAFTSEKDRTYDEVARIIAGARRVMIFGVGGSSAILAQEAHNRLFRLNIVGNACTDSYMQRMTAATLGEGDVAFFISSTGRPRALLDSADLAKHYGAQCVGIGPAESPLGRLLDVCINVHLDGPPVDEFQPSPMRYAQLFALDSIAFRVASLIETQASTTLARTRASVAALHGVVPNQPIGD